MGSNQWFAPKFPNAASSSISYVDFTLNIAIQSTLAWMTGNHTPNTPNPYIQSSGSNKFRVVCSTTSATSDLKIVWVMLICS